VLRVRFRKVNENYVKYHHYLCNCLSLDIGIYFCIVVIILKEHFPSVWQIPPQTLFVGKMKNKGNNMKMEVETREFKLVNCGI